MLHHASMATCFLSDYIIVLKMCKNSPSRIKCITEDFNESFQLHTRTKRGKRILMLFLDAALSRSKFGRVFFCHSTTARPYFNHVHPREEAAESGDDNNGKKLFVY